MQNSKADLKNAQRRIETLHGALKGHEGYSDEDVQDDTLGSYDDDDLSSNASSYKVGELDDMSIDDLSDTEGSGLLDESPPVRTRTWERSKRSQSRDLTPMLEEDEATGKRQRKISADSEDDAAVELTKYDKKDDIGSTNNQTKDYLKDNEDDLKPRRKYSDIKLSDEEYDISIKPRKTIDLSEDNKYSSSSLKREEAESRGSSLTRTGRRADLYDDEDEDDDDLEEFLLKQRERTRRLKDEGDNFEPISARSSLTKRSTSPISSETKSNGRLPKDDDLSREELEGGDNEVFETARQRRKRQRRRTIEQLTSPEHKSAKANGGGR